MGVYGNGPSYSYAIATDAYRYSIYGVFPDDDNYSNYSAGVIGTYNLTNPCYGALAYVDGYNAICSIYGNMGDGTYSAYFDVSDPTSMAAVVIDDDGVDPLLRPSEAGTSGSWGWGLVGTSTHWWDKMYANSYYSEIDNYDIFDTYDDLKLLNNIKTKTYWDPILKHHIMKIIPETMPRCVTNYEEISSGKTENVFVNISNMNGLLIGATRQLDRETKKRAQRLIARTDILANAVGIDFSKDMSEKTTITINDFGSASSNKNKIIVYFSDKFKEKLNNEDLPVVNITPTSPYKNFYISETNKNSFTVIVDTDNNNFSFNWNAFAKTQVKNISAEIDHIDDVFYRKSFEIPQGDYPVYNSEKKKIKKNSSVSLNKIKVQKSSAQEKSQIIRHKEHKKIKTN